jgi:hypothetical protein
VARHLKVATNIVVVCPVRNMTVPVSVSVHSSDPGYEESEWDHIAECSLDLPSGHLGIEECTGGTVASLSVAPGGYRVRVRFRGLDTIDGSGLEGEDSYQVDLWKAPRISLSVVNQWHGEHHAG